MNEVTQHPVGGPHYEDLHVGQVFDTSPGLTLTEGHAAAHQAIVGDRLQICLDSELCQAVTGFPRLANPALVWDVAIGQSTGVTQLVVANMFYRGLVLRRMPQIGDTLRTVTKVVALRDNSPREGRAPTGLAALRIRTTDQEDRVVLDFHRCAMLPMRAESSRPGNAHDLAEIPDQLPPAEILSEAVREWDLHAYRQRVPGPHSADLEPGSIFEIKVGDSVTAATELVRLTLNLAAIHVDSTASVYGKRLVYGGHTISVALAQVTRALPNLVTVLGWRYCDHVAPVFERDILRTVVTVESVSALDRGGAVASLRVETVSQHESGECVKVLKWGMVALFA